MNHTVEIQISETSATNTPWLMIATFGITAIISVIIFITVSKKQLGERGERPKTGKVERTIIVTTVVLFIVAAALALASMAKL